MLPSSTTSGSSHFPVDSTDATQNTASRKRKSCPSNPATSSSSIARSVRMVENDLANLSVRREGDDTGTLVAMGELESNSSSWLGNAWGMVRRVAQITAKTVPLYMSGSQLTVDNARQFTELGGLVGGKLMQVLAPQFRDPEFRTDINSRFPVGEIDPEKVESVLQRNLLQAQNASANTSIAGDFSDVGPRTKRARSGGQIEYVGNLGRGTVGQVDHFIINGRSYAVKCVSEELSGEIHKDVLVLKNVFLPLMRATGNLPINEIDISHYIDALESFEQEGNLSIELDHTKTQGRVLADLSRTKSYSVPVPETLDLGNHIQRIPVKFKVPEIAEHISSPDAMVMELINGCTLDRDAVIARLFDQWKPDWSGGERLGIDSFEVENIMKELRTLLVKVYVEAARKSGFINSDFQEGNFMLKLESDHIGIYFIDHGNCISVDNFDQAAQSLLCDSLVTDLFLFFHQRYHGNDNPLSVSEFSELCQTDSVMDSVIYPLTDDYLQDDKKFINDWRKIFASKQDSEFTLRRYSPGMKIRGICSDIYQLFQLRWTSSPETGQSISEEDFFQGLINLLSKAVLKNKQIDDANKKQVCSDVVHSFDDYLYEKGFRSPGNALLMRVFIQIQAYNQRTRDDY